MPISITTAYKGPTNTRGGYIKAVASAQNPTTGKPYERRVPYQHQLSSVVNHQHAAHALAVLMGLDTFQWVFGDAPKEGYVFLPYHGEVVELGKEATGPHAF